MCVLYMCRLLQKGTKSGPRSLLSKVRQVSSKGKSATHKQEEGYLREDQKSGDVLALGRSLVNQAKLKKQKQVNCMLHRKIHTSWEGFLTPEIREMILVCEEWLKGEAFYPEKENVLRFLETDKNNIKVVIVGMEPYPSAYESDGRFYPVATGRSFEIRNISDWGSKYKQSSMRNILKCIYYNERGVKPSMEELRSEIASGEFPILQPRAWFNSMEEQGVLFLNATLTVRQGVAGTKFHEDIWAEFVTILIQELEKFSPE